MPTTLQHRRGTSTCAASLTLCAGEFFIDCQTNTVYLHDGSTVGGRAVGKYTDSNNNISILSNNKLGSNDTALGLGSLANNITGANTISIGYNSLCSAKNPTQTVSIGFENMLCSGTATGLSTATLCSNGYPYEVVGAVTNVGAYNLCNCYISHIPMCAISGQNPTCAPVVSVYLDSCGSANYGLNVNSSGSGLAANTVLTLDTVAWNNIVGNTPALTATSALCWPAKIASPYNTIAIGTNNLSCLGDSQWVTAIGHNVLPNITGTSCAAIQNTVAIGNTIGSCMTSGAVLNKSVLIGTDLARCWVDTSSYDPAIMIGSTIGWTNGPIIAIGSNIANYQCGIGYNNVVIGNYALTQPQSCSFGNCSGNGYTDGTTVVGSNAGQYGGDCNTYIGMNAGAQAYCGAGNVFVGAYAGQNCNNGAFQAGCNNVFLGYQSMSMSCSAFNNRIYLGNSSTQCIYSAVTSISSLSDCRDKTNVTDLPIGLEFVNALRPVKFDWNTRDGSKQGEKDFGFLAQEVAIVEDANDSAVYTDLVGRDEEEYTIRMTRFVPLLVKAIQELSNENDSLKSRIEALENK